MPNAILRYEVPVDHEWHDIELSGQIVHVASRRDHIVELWAVASDAPAVTRSFRVYGTGWPIPEEGLRHVGTAITQPQQGLVWHLMERA